MSEIEAAQNMSEQAKTDSAKKQSDTDAQAMAAMQATTNQY